VSAFLESRGVGGDGPLDALAGHVLSVDVAAAKKLGVA
jgi:hypothetical protein